MRYRGRNETEACQIIWDKIEEEIKIRKKDADWWQHQQDLANDPVYAEEYDKELERRVLKPNYGTKKPAKKKHPVRNALLTSMAVAGIVADVQRQSDILPQIIRIPVIIPTAIHCIIISRRPGITGTIPITTGYSTIMMPMRTTGMTGTMTVLLYL